MTRSIILGFAVLLTLRVVHAQTSQDLQRDPAWTAPASASGKPNPFVNRPEMAAGGRKVFLQRCATCHGDDGRGSERAPDVSAPGVQAQSDGALFWKISSGNSRTGMPAFSFLPEPQRWQLVLHLRTLGHDVSDH